MTPAAVLDHQADQHTPTDRKITMTRSPLAYALRSFTVAFLALITVAYVAASVASGAPWFTTVSYALLFAAVTAMSAYARWQAEADRQERAREQVAYRARRAADERERDIAAEQRALEDDVVAASRAARAGDLALPHTPEAQAILDRRDAEFTAMVAAERAARRARLDEAGLLADLEHRAA